MPDPYIGLSIGASLLGSSMQADAASEAAGTQAQSAEAGIAEQRRQFDALQALLKPYTEVGVSAIEAQQAFLGMKGPEAEQAAIQRIRGGETFKTLAQQGEEALLQRASATGGLRGGNIQGALAQFRPELLSSLIDQQYGRLGGLAKIGQASAAGVGAGGMEAGTNIANLLANQGRAIAGGQIGEARAYGKFLEQPFRQFGFRAGRNTFDSLGNEFSPSGTPIYDF